jgi:mannose-6-phosphate isomerase-like protein (cupin superfamily)
MTATMSSPTGASRSSTTKKSAAQVIPPGAGRAYWAVGDRLTFKLGTEHTAGAFSVAEVRVSPGGGPPPHVHHREDEIFYLLEGSLQFIKGDERFEGSAGDAFYLPRGVPHAFKNASDRPARALVFATPCGFENFIPEFGTPVEQSPEAPPVTQAEIDRLLAACQRYGLEMKFDHRPRSATPIRPKSLYKPLWVLGEHVQMQLTSRESNGTMNLATLTSRPGGGPPPHVHTDCDELFYVENGSYEFLVGDRRIVGEPGTLVYIPAGTMHCFKNVGSINARLLTIHTPGGFEGFYTEMGTEVIDPSRPPTEPLDIARVREITAKHHMILK